jgi:hypothetical protein
MPTTIPAALAKVLDAKRQANMDRIAAHLDALARHGLTVETCPVCVLCPTIPGGRR